MNVSELFLSLADRGHDDAQTAPGGPASEPVRLAGNVLPLHVNHMSTLFATRDAEPGDVALLAEAGRGDLEAFGTLYRRHQQRVYRFARAMTGSNDAAEDITQEVFVVLLTDVGRFDPTRAAFTTYVYGIVRNLSRHRVRRDRSGPSLDEMMREGHDVDADTDPSRLVEGAELAGAVRRALASLPSRYRELIVLCDLHDLSYEEAGVIVHASIGAVRSRLHKGRQLLRLRLARVRETHRATGDLRAVRCHA
jgi:RNA polymerase sigma-70 factor, ECF subfamily